MSRGLGDVYKRQAIVKAKRDGNKPLRLTIEADGLEKATVDIEIDHE